VPASPPISAPERWESAAEALAALVDNPTADEVIPSPFDERVVSAVSAVIK